MLGHYNIRQYVLWRDGYTCRCCGTHGKGVKFHVHHLESRKTGGNAPDNLVTLCDGCHKKFHKGIITPDILKKRKRRSTRDAAFMGIMRKTLMERLRAELAIQVVETKGYITKYTRVELLKLEKTHTNDALAIAQGRRGFGVEELTTIPQSDYIYRIRPVRHHNRQLHKATILPGGIRKSNQAPRYVWGFRLFDKVSYLGEDCFIWGRRSSGSFLLKLLDGTKVKDGVGYKRISLLERSASYLIS